MNIIGYGDAPSVRRVFHRQAMGLGGGPKETHLRWCPSCNKKSLFWNPNWNTYECLNPACKRVFTKDELRRRESITKREPDSRWANQAGHVEGSHGGDSPRFRKTLLFLLVTTCSAAVPYTGYLLWQHRIGPIAGGAVLLIEVGVVIFIVSLLRKYRVGLRGLLCALVLSALVCSALSAFGGLGPFAGAKDKISAFFQGTSLLRLGGVSPRKALILLI